MFDDGFHSEASGVKANPKDVYMNLLFSTFEKCAGIAASQEPPAMQTKRLEYLTRMLVAFVINPKERANLNKYLDDRLVEERAKARKNDIDSDEWNNIVWDLNTEVVGKVISLTDDFIGVVERQEILHTLEPEIKSALMKKYGLEE